MFHLKQPIKTEKSLGDGLTHMNKAWRRAHKHGGKFGFGLVQSRDRKRNAGGEFCTWSSILRPNRKFGKVFDWLFFFFFLLCSVCCVPGVESSAAAAAGPVHPPARRPRREAATPTKRPEGETGSGSFSLAWALRQDCLVPGQHISVTMDVQVRHCRTLGEIPVRLKILSKMAGDWFLFQWVLGGVSAAHLDLQRSVSDLRLPQPAGWGWGRVPGG